MHDDTESHHENRKACVDVTLREEEVAPVTYQGVNTVTDNTTKERHLVAVETT